MRSILRNALKSIIFATLFECKFPVKLTIFPDLKFCGEKNYWAKVHFDAKLHNRRYQIFIASMYILAALKSFSSYWTRAMFAQDSRLSTDGGQDEEENEELKTRNR